MRDVALPAALALIMVVLGLSLTPDDFRRVATRPRGVLLGLANLVVIAPLLAFAVAELFALEPVFAVGLVLLGASPGGTLANLLTHLARGDTALSVSMTALSSVAAVVTVPVYLGLAVAHFGAPVDDDVQVAGVVAPVFAITIVPLAIGMAVRARRPAWAAAHERPARRVAGTAFALAVVGVVASEAGTVTENLDVLAGAALTLNVSAMAVSFTLARLARLDLRQATAVAMELGIHNAALAIAVGSLIADDLTIPAAVYSSFMFLTAGAFARLVYRRNTLEPAPAPA
jgi:BASS family bile acid:Na+ symporter